MNTRPATDSAGGHSMLLQYKVVRVTHLMMNKATIGPQWNTLNRLVEDIVADSPSLSLSIFLGDCKFFCFLKIKMAER